MNSKLICVLTLLSLLSGVFSQVNEGCPGGGDFDGLTGHIQYNKKGTTVPGNVEGSCVWTIHVNESAVKNSSGIFLFANSFFLDDPLSVTIEIRDNKTSKSEPYLTPFKGKLDPFGIFISNHSVDTIVTVTLKLFKVKDAVAGQFQMQYCTTGCKFLTTIKDTGVMKFPLYSNAIDPFNCSLDFVADINDMNDVHLVFKELTLGNPKDVLTIFGANDGMDGDFSSTKRPMTEILAKDSLTLNLTVTNTSIADNITVVYDLVNAACNGYVKLVKDRPLYSLTTPTTDDDKFYSRQSFDCLWIVESEPNTIIKFDLKNLNFTSSSDQILILDGANQSAPFITSLTRANFLDWKSKFIQTSSNKAWVSITTPLAMKDFKIQIDVTQTSGGYSSQPGPFGKDLQDGVYLYKFKEGEQVEFTLNENGTAITGDTKLTFLRDLGLLNPAIEIITKDNYKNVKTIVSMEHTMAILVENIKGSTVNATLTTLAPGCYAEGTGTAGSYSLTGKCNDKCAWTIPPKKNSTDEITLHFTSIQIDSGDSLKISKHDDKETLIVELKGSLNTIPDVIVNASDGVIIEVNRQNCSISKTMIQASYAVKSVCQMEQSTKGGQTIQLSSPNYPNQYPLMALCTYKVTRQSNESLLHVSFDSLELAAGHNLVLSKLVVTGNKTDQVVLDIFNSSSTTLPNDYLVKNDIIITFVTRSDLKSGLKTAKGFSVKVLNMDNGGVVADKVGNITTPGYPDKVKQGSLFAWVVSVNSMNTTDTKNIISFKAGNLTKEEELKKFVTIFDGPSIREAPLNNMTGDELLSRTNTLIFLYKHENLTQEGPPMLFEFQAYACNNSLMCDNKICMHEDWKCNGKNDCGDYSDEKDCQGTAPPPPPPSPAPRPATAGGTSTTALTLGILAALIIGILLGVAAPAAYRRIAGNRFSTYSTFSNTPE